MSASNRPISARSRGALPRRATACMLGGLLLAALGVLGGCMHVIAHRTPYYEKGPTQLEPPQGELDAGTGVWVVGKEDTYLHVLAPGVNAYVLGQDVLTRGEWRKLQRRENDASQDANTIVVQPGEPVRKPEDR